MPEKSASYRYYNNNPKHLRTDDCVLRSLSVAEGISWNECQRKLSYLSAIEGLILNDVEFVENYLDFCLDLTKYCLFRNLSCTKIPSTLEQRCIGYSNIPDILDYSNNLVEKVLEIKTMIKYDPAALTTVEAMFIKICRGI